ncbi:MAG: hypothetical protein P8100_06660 [bacterium]
MKKQSNLFTDKDSIQTIDSKRIIYLVIAVSFFLLTEMGRKIYRPYIYQNNIEDFGLADSIGNLGGIVVQIFLTLAILNSPGKKGVFIIVFIVLGYILYEILQPFLPRGVFDWKDIYGTLIGGTIATLIWLATGLIVQNKVMYKF